MVNDTPQGGVGSPERPASEPAAAQMPESPPQMPETPSGAMYPGPRPGYGPPAAPYPPYGYPPNGYPYPPRRPSNGRIGWVIGLFVGLALIAGLVVALIIGVIGLAIRTGTGTPYTDTTTKTFAVTGAPTLDIRDTAGNVTIQRGDAGRVTVQITKNVHTFNESVAHRELGKMVVTTTQNGNAIGVATSFSATFFDGVPSTRSVDLVVTVPADATATTHLNAGNLTVSDIRGAMNLETNAGNIEATGVVFAEDSRLSTNAGNITVNGSMRPAVLLEVNTNAGNVTMALPASTPAHLDSRVNVGSISVNGWPITVSRANSVGAAASGDLGTPATGTVSVTVSAGNFTLTSR